MRDSEHVRQLVQSDVAALRAAVPTRHCWRACHGVLSQSTPRCFPYSKPISECAMDANAHTCGTVLAIEPRVARSPAEVASKSPAGRQ
eukprot:2888566-Prymnesium_polylepis.1